MLQLCYVLQLVVDGLYHGSLSDQYLVRDTHEAVLHVVPHLGYQLYPVREQLVEQFLGDVTLVSHKLSVYLLHEARDLQRFPVVDIRRGNHEAKDLAFLVDDDVQLEPEEPSQGALAPHGDALEHLVAVDALVTAHTHGCGVDEVDARALAKQHLLDKDQQGKGHFPLQFHEPVVRHGLCEKAVPMSADVVEVEVLEAAVSAHMEDDQYRDDLRVRHAVGLVAVAFPVTYLESVFFHRLIEKLAEVVCHAVNFRNFVVR